MGAGAAVLVENGRDSAATQAVEPIVAFEQARLTRGEGVGLS